MHCRCTGVVVAPAHQGKGCCVWSSLPTPLERDQIRHACLQAASFVPLLPARCCRDQGMHLLLPVLCKAATLQGNIVTPAVLAAVRWLPR